MYFYSVLFTSIMFFAVQAKVDENRNSSPPNISVSLNDLAEKDEDTTRDDASQDNNDDSVSSSGKFESQSQLKQ